MGDVMSDVVNRERIDNMLEKLFDVIDENHVSAEEAIAIVFAFAGCTTGALSTVTMNQNYDDLVDMGKPIMDMYAERGIETFRMKVIN